MIVRGFPYTAGDTSREDAHNAGGFSRYPRVTTSGRMVMRRIRCVAESANAIGVEVTRMRPMRMAKTLPAMEERSYA
jgi:hypothetical protein